MRCALADAMIQRSYRYRSCAIVSVCESHVKTRVVLKSASVHSGTNV